MDSRLDNAESRMNGTEGRLTTVESLVASMEVQSDLLEQVQAEVDILNSKAIVEDFFYINKADIRLKGEDCFPIMTVEKY